MSTSGVSLNSETQNTGGSWTVKSVGTVIAQGLDGNGADVAVTGDIVPTTNKINTVGSTTNLWHQMFTNYVDPEPAGSLYLGLNGAHTYVGGSSDANLVGATSNVGNGGTININLISSSGAYIRSPTVTTDSTCVNCVWNGTNSVQLVAPSVYVGNTTATTNLYLGSSTATTAINGTSTTISSANTYVSGTANIGAGTNANGNMYMGTGTAQYLVQATGGQFYVNSSSSGGVYLANATATAWSARSDARLKKNVHDFGESLPKLQQLRPVAFQWKDAPEDTRPTVGFIAQEFERQFPEMVDRDKENYLGIRYVELVPVLVKAIQELGARVEQLEDLLYKSEK